MQRTRNIQNNQKVSASDFVAMGSYPRESFDSLVADLGGFTAPRYVGFAVEQTAPSELRVGTGRYYKADGSVYGFDADGGATIDLLDHLPAVAKRVATIVVWGNAIDTALEPRTFLVDAGTGETEGREVAVENRRQAYVDKVLGQESATPQPAAIGSDFVAVAHIVLTPAGVESITQLTGNQLVSVRANLEKITEHEARFAAVGPQIDTLKTDIFGLGSSLRNKADFAFVRSLAGDVARIKEEIGLPDDYTAWGADRFLDLDETDTAAAGYAADVREGVRFPAIASVTVPITLENPLENRLYVNDNMALPSHASVTRLSVVGRDGEHALTSSTVETVELKQRTETRTRRIYYGTERQCTNSVWWRSGQYDAASGLFRRAGEVFAISTDRGPVDQWGLTRWIRAPRYVDETVQQTYWDRVEVSENVTGSIVAQTFLNSQDGWLTHADLYFTKKAAAGDVRVMIVETVDGEPMLDRVLAKKTITPADLSLYPLKTAVAFKPTFLAKGTRYALVVISSGSHFLATVSNNKFAQGAIYYSIDGAMVQGDLFTDLAFGLRFAVFNAPIVTVQLGALELAGGIGTIDINSDSAIPEGTALEFQVRVGAEWRKLGPQDGNVLATLPSLAQFRAVFIGTTDVMPAIGVGATRSAVRLSRAANVMKHVSAARNLPAPINTVELVLKLENFDADVHTLTPTILCGAGFATIETADLVVDRPDPQEPTTILRTATFNLAAPADAYQIAVVGATTDPAAHFHVAERTDVAFA
jgi:hypothetical protein